MKNQKNQKRKIQKKQKRKIQKNRKEKNSKKIEKKNQKKENPKNQKKKKEKENSKKIEKRRSKKKRNLFSVVLDKICVLCLYPIPDSQQYVKRDSCRRPILSGLLCLFSFFLDLGPICVKVRVQASNLFLLCHFYFIESSDHFVLVKCRVVFVLYRVVFRIHLRQMSFY